MNILQLIIFAFVALLVYLLLKEINEVYAFILLLISTIIIFFLIIGQIGAVFQLLLSLGNKAMINDVYLSTIFKIVSIAYVIEFSTNMIRDVGLNALASKVELAGKLSILLLAIPIITAVIEALLQFLPAS